MDQLPSLYLTFMAAMEECWRDSVAAKQGRMIGVRIINGNPMMFVAELDGKEVGSMCVTILPLVHDMEIQSGLLQLAIADALHEAAKQKVREAGFDEAMVMVEQANLAMRRYVERLCAKEEPPAVAYHMNTL